MIRENLVNEASGIWKMNDVFIEVKNSNWGNP
jgi:hypothetical protein